MHARAEETDDARCSTAEHRRAPGNGGESDLRGISAALTEQIAVDV